MISQKVNGLERRIQFKPGFHRVDEGYGVHGMEIWFVLIGEKGAVHFGLSTGMMLQQTRDWWKKEAKDGALGLFPMGIDVGYHSPVPMYEWQKIVWPTKMRKLSDKPFDYAFDKIGDEPPVCEWIGKPCYCDGSAMRAETYQNVFLEKGDEEIWKMLEEEYKGNFETTV